MKNIQSKWVLGNLITPFQPTGNYDLVLGKTSALPTGLPSHSHQKLNKLLFLLQGVLELRVQGKKRKIYADDLVDFSLETIHTFLNSTESTSKWLNIPGSKGIMQLFHVLNYRLYLIFYCSYNFSGSSYISYQTTALIYNFNPQTAPTWQ